MVSKQIKGDLNMEDDGTLKWWVWIMLPIIGFLLTPFGTFFYAIWFNLDFWGVVCVTGIQLLIYILIGIISNFGE
jgi:hypothetical protein